MTGVFFDTLQIMQTVKEGLILEVAIFGYSEL